MNKYLTLAIDTGFWLALAVFCLYGIRDAYRLMRRLDNDERI